MEKLRRKAYDGAGRERGKGKKWRKAGGKGRTGRECGAP